MISRRVLLAAPLLAGAVLSPSAAEAAEPGEDVHRALAALEAQHGGRLGVAILHTVSHRWITYRGEERFALCSTHKALSAAFVLERVDREEESLTRRVVYGRDVLVPYSPETAKHAGGEGMTIAELCAAAVTLSDNTAANLLLDSFGGPPALTSFLRGLGDKVTRLDRREPALNEVEPGDPRDTTTPMAMAETLRRLAVGDELSTVSRERLAAWLVDCKTGDKRLRARVPQGWRIGDKTGTGPHHATNDVAVIWPPNRAPVIVTAFYCDAQADNQQRDAVLAEIGRIAIAI